MLALISPTPAPSCSGASAAAGSATRCRAPAWPRPPRRQRGRIRTRALAARQGPPGAGLAGARQIRRREGVAAVTTAPGRRRTRGAGLRVASPLPSCRSPHSVSARSTACCSPTASTSSEHGSRRAHARRGGPRPRRGAQAADRRHVGRAHTMLALAAPLLVAGDREPGRVADPAAGLASRTRRCSPRSRTAAPSGFAAILPLHAHSTGCSRRRRGHWPAQRSSSSRAASRPAAPTPTRSSILSSPRTACWPPWSEGSSSRTSARSCRRSP